MVSPGARRAGTQAAAAVCLPASCSLDLDAWINEPPSDSESEDEKPKAIFHDEEQRHAKQRQPEAEEEELARVSTGRGEAGLRSLRGRWPRSEQTLDPEPPAG